MSQPALLLQRLAGVVASLLAVPALRVIAFRDDADDAWVHDPFLDDDVPSV